MRGIRPTRPVKSTPSSTAAKIRRAADGHAPAVAPAGVFFERQALAPRLPDLSHLASQQERRKLSGALVGLFPKLSACCGDARSHAELDRDCGQG
jgi:hypothetical protein